MYQPALANGPAVRFTAEPSRRTEVRQKTGASVRGGSQALCVAAIAGARRVARTLRRPHGRLRPLCALEPAAAQATEVLVDFQAFVEWLVNLERMRGKSAPRTYRSLDRRVKSLTRRLKVRGIHLCFVAKDAADCCSAPEDAHLWLAEEQIRASLKGSCWKKCHKLSQIPGTGCLPRGLPSSPKRRRGRAPARCKVACSPWLLRVHWKAMCLGGYSERKEGLRMPWMRDCKSWQLS
ncbi:unnamed protein product [Effrenium voratum]|nr:unnamed protein product [Effrenium voratum]